MSTSSSHMQSQAIVVSCAICGLKASNRTSSIVPIRDLKPRFSRHILRIYPFLTKRKCVCVSHVVSILQHRIDELLQEDLSQFTRLQEDAMRNLEQYEIDSKNWQDQFESDRSLADKAADAVARVGGSWSFVFAILGFILGWAILNLLLDKVWNIQVDPYPFILLNLCLSMIAATQAPVIMMAQNRQAERDRAQNIFVSDAILRNEHQTKHVEAKLDHLLSFQWKRLLEIHEIQSNLLQFYAFSQTRHPKEIPFHKSEEPTSSSPVMPSMVFAMHQQQQQVSQGSLVREPLPMSSPTSSSFPPPQSQSLPTDIIQNPFLTPGGASLGLPIPGFHPHTSSGLSFAAQPGIFKAETVPDPMTHLLLRHYFGADEPGDVFLFSHWHEDGDNFSAIVSHVSLQLADGHLQHIHFSLQFPHTAATMDDLFSGEASVILRNDFGVPHMHMHGRISRVRVHFPPAPQESTDANRKDGPRTPPQTSQKGRRRILTWLNGELPPRYKPAFALRRHERVTEIWKTHVNRVDLVYTPPPQVAAVHVPEGYELTNVCVTVFPSNLTNTGNGGFSGDAKGSHGGLDDYVGGRIPEKATILVAVQEKEEGVRFLLEKRSFLGLSDSIRSRQFSSDGGLPPIASESSLSPASSDSEERRESKGEGAVPVATDNIKAESTKPKRTKQVRLISRVGKSSIASNNEATATTLPSKNLTLNSVDVIEEDEEEPEPDLELEPYAHRMDNPLQYLYALVAPRPLPSPVWQSLVSYNWTYGTAPLFSSNMIDSKSEQQQQQPRRHRVSHSATASGNNPVRITTVTNKDENSEADPTASTVSASQRSHHMYASPRMVPFGPSGPSGASMMSTGSYSRLPTSSRLGPRRGISATNSLSSALGWKTPPLLPQPFMNAATASSTHPITELKSPAPFEEMESFGLFDPNDSFHESPRPSEAPHLYPYPMYLAGATADAATLLSPGSGVHILSGGSSTTSPMTLALNMKLKGPATYIFFCEETKVDIHGMFVLSSSKSSS